MAVFTGKPAIIFSYALFRIERNRRVDSVLSNATLTAVDLNRFRLPNYSVTWLKEQELALTQTNHAASLTARNITSF